MGFPSIQFAIAQGLLCGLFMLTLPMIYAFGGRLKMSTGDLLLLIPIFPVFALVTMAVFLPFEGNWADAAFGPLGTLRALIIGGSAVLLGTLYTRRKTLVGMSANDVAHRLGAAFLIGAVWGVLWSLSGWILDSVGMVSNG